MSPPGREGAGLDGLRGRGFDVMTSNHAQAILGVDFAPQLAELTGALGAFRLSQAELIGSGGGEAAFTQHAKLVRSDVIRENANGENRAAATTSSPNTTYEFVGTGCTCPELRGDCFICGVAIAIKTLSELLEEIIRKLPSYYHTNINDTRLKEASKCIEIAIICLIFAVPFVIECDAPTPEINKMIMNVIFPNDLLDHRSVSLPSA